MMNTVGPAIRKNTISAIVAPPLRLLRNWIPASTPGNRGDDEQRGDHDNDHDADGVRHRDVPEEVEPAVDLQRAEAGRGRGAGQRGEDREAVDRAAERMLARALPQQRRERRADEV